MGQHVPQRESEEENREDQTHWPLRIRVQGLVLSGQRAELTRGPVLLPSQPGGDLEVTQERDAPQWLTYTEAH